MSLEILGIVILLAGLTAATITDIKTKEIPNWVSFSMIITGLFLALLKSLQSSDFNFLLQSLKGFGAFFIIGNIMYYTQQWGGGDARLIAGIGALIPTYPTILLNLFSPKLVFDFIFIILINVVVIGAIYGLGYSLFLMIRTRNQFSKVFNKSMSKYKKQLKSISLISLIGIILAMIFLPSPISLFLSTLLIMPPILIFLIIAIKALEKMSLIKYLSPSKLREGDWVLEEIKIKDKIIYKPTFQGLNGKQLELIKKSNIKKVKVKEGIAFVPAITIAVILSLILGNLMAYALP